MTVMWLSCDIHIIYLCTQLLFMTMSINTPHILIYLRNKKQTGVFFLNTHNNWLLLKTWPYLTSSFSRHFHIQSKYQVLSLTINEQLIPSRIYDHERWERCLKKCEDVPNIAWARVLFMTCDQVRLLTWEGLYPIWQYYRYTSSRFLIFIKITVQWV